MKVRARAMLTPDGVVLVFERAPGRFEPMFDGATGKPAIIRDAEEMRAALNARNLKSGGSNVHC